ncbi:MAG: DUF2961 domain-containing protein [Verrucomicrobia bacterium]|nr:DUF2961 domain-containing protein [Verrucomicrobiota bacterium]
MKNVLCSLGLWSVCLCALGADSKVDPARLKTFSAIGKERPDLNGYKEAELLRHDGKGCLTHLDTKKNTFSAYRFHDDDPLFFQKGLRLTCRCGEELNGKMLHNPPDTRFTTYTWVYEW